MGIHPTAIIDGTAKIGTGNDIGPYVIIEGNVSIGNNNTIMPHAFIGKNTTIGDGNEIHMGAVVGHFPQDKSFQKNNETFLIVGNNNVIREYVTIHRGTESKSTTKIGHHCLIMGGAHIAHDCQLGNGVIMANMSGIAGYVQVADRAILSGGSMIHQFVRIGSLAILAGNCRISMDVPPFTIAGERNQTWGINLVGLKRANFTAQQIRDIRSIYRLFSKPLPTKKETINHMRNKEYSHSKEHIDYFIDFIEKSERGTCSHSRQKDMS